VFDIEEPLAGELVRKLLVRAKIPTGKHGAAASTEVTTATVSSHFAITLPTNFIG
jgi:hypothetical protein